MLLFTSVALLLTMGVANSQFITFKDGKIGVNFAGFHADAGLGGLLTGDRAHGGLSASAGTPWGPRAAAGINGGLDDGAFGTLYAGAEADRSVGASAALSGNTRGYGIGASEAHAYGKSYGAVMGHNRDYAAPPPPMVTSGPPPAEPHEYTNVIQKVKPPKKYSLIAAEPPHKSHIAEPVVTATTAVSDGDRKSTVARPRASDSDASAIGRPLPTTNGSLVVIVKGPQWQRQRHHDRHRARKHRLTRPHQSQQQQEQPQQQQKHDTALQQYQKEEKRRDEQLQQRRQQQREQQQQHSGIQQPNNVHAEAEADANAAHSYHIRKTLERRALEQPAYEREPEPAELPRRGLQLARGILGTISDALAPQHNKK